VIPVGKPGCGEIRQALGVYVVGAIDPAERSVVDQHLATCRACRDELAGLAGLPALLGRVTLAEAERVPSAAAREAPPQLLDSMLTEQARRRSARRRRSILVAAAASVAVLAGGAATAVLVTGSGAGPRPPVAVASPQDHWQMDSGRSAATDVSAIVRYRQQSWGTEIQVWVSGVPTGTRCQLVVIDSSGRHMVAGGWNVPVGERSDWYPGSAPVAAETISSFQITSHGKALVTLLS
jgi:Putative zinc-finger